MATRGTWVVLAMGEAHCQGTMMIMQTSRRCWKVTHSISVFSFQLIATAQGHSHLRYAEHLYSQPSIYRESVMLALSDWLSWRVHAPRAHMCRSLDPSSVLRFSPSARPCEADCTAPPTELGINFEHIMTKTILVLHPMKATAGQFQE
jgi:hypothetical protein